MSRDTVDGCLETSLHVSDWFGWAWWSVEGLVVAVGVDGELAQELAAAGVDDAEVAVGDEGQDPFGGVFAAEADVAQFAVVADGGSQPRR